ncbi:glycosyltransferase family 4 protein [Haladaptatus sp. DYSN1]|uniref:glycosyltransferase family 4 protein n=1 Tax=unclassified Haladaptatus TaxID=2622732 RepID=UPI002406CBFA|nr:glycosyltransferase family 4 protein [Haladaptatus sp. DYSN1]
MSYKSVAPSPQLTNDERPIRVLNLVTSPSASFFRQQVNALEKRGVSCTDLPVSEMRLMTDEVKERRPATDYVRFYAKAFKESFGEFDLVHANSGLTAPPAVVQPNLPVVISFWGSDLMGTLGPMSKLCARRADAVIVMSQEMADELGMDCHVIPHGVNMEMFTPMSKTAAREHLGWDQDATYVLFPYPASRGIKDYPRAKRVVDAARERFDGDLRLQTVYEVEHEEMPYYMNAADAMILTSKREGSPNATKEALACNLPVVSVDVGDIQQQLGGVGSAVIANTDEELTEGLLALLTADHLPESREWAMRTMSVESMAERIHAVYEQVLEAN